MGFPDSSDHLSPLSHLSSHLAQSLAAGAGILMGSPDSSDHWLSLPTQPPILTLSSESSLAAVAGILMGFPDSSDHLSTPSHQSSHLAQSLAAGVKGPHSLAV